MADPFGVTAAKTIERAIARGNLAVTVSRETSTDDASEPWREDTTATTTYTTRGWLGRYRLDELNDTILATDRRLIISPRDLVDADGAQIVPSTDDRVTVGGNAYAIVAIKPVKPTGTPLLYVLQLRQ